MPDQPLSSVAATAYDVVVVGAGPSGSACAYWLARAGWSVCVVEKKEFPRAKTCGDGLTPRSVRQLADMGLEGEVAAHGHRFGGLRAHGFGASLEMNWPEHPRFPGYGYTITRFDLDELVAHHARALGAVVVTHAEATDLLEPSPGGPGRLAGARGVAVRDVATGECAELRARYVVAADGQHSRLGRALGVERNRRWPMGMALRSYYTSDRHDEPWIDSYLELRDEEGRAVPGYGWVFPLGDGRLNVGVGLLTTAGAWRGVNTTRLQERFVAQIGDEWGLDATTSLGAPTGGRLPMGFSRGPRVGANTLVVGDAASAINPFNGEGIAYAYETGRLAAAVLGEALRAEDASVLEGYETRLEARYGDYYSLARAFVRVLSEPRVLAACVGAGLRVAPVMRELLVVMANLMRDDEPGPAERGYRASLRLARALPESVWAALFDEES